MPTSELDHVTEQYLEECLSTASRLRTVTSEIDSPYRLLARPMFLPERESKTIGADLAAFLDLLTSLPGRFFDGNVLDYCAALGMPERRAQLLARVSEGRPVNYGRADLYHDGTAFKLLEFNVASDLGVVGALESTGRLMELPAFRAFADRFGLSYVDTGQQVAATLRKAASALPCGTDPVVAIVCSDRDFAGYQWLLHALRDYLRRQGLTVVVATLGQLQHRNNRLRVDTIEVDVVFRYFTIDSMCDDDSDAQVITRIVDAHRNGTLVLWTPMDSSLCSNKAALGLLSHPRWQAELTSSERELIDRVLPWTRYLVDEPDPVVGDLVDYCRDHREELIVKPTTEYGGAGIVAGWETSDPDWRALLEERRGHAHIVQRRVRPRPAPVVNPTTGQLEDWIPVWGAFVTPEGPAGTGVRAVPDTCGAVVTYGNPQARIAGVFSYPDLPVVSRPT